MFGFIAFIDDSAGTLCLPFSSATEARSNNATWEALRGVDVWEGIPPQIALSNSSKQTYKNIILYAWVWGRFKRRREN